MTWGAVRRVLLAALLAATLVACTAAPDLVDAATRAGLAEAAEDSADVVEVLADDPAAARSLLLDAVDPTESWRALLESDVAPESVAGVVAGLSADPSLTTSLLTAAGAGTGAARDADPDTVLLVLDALGPAIRRAATPSDTGLTDDVFEGTFDGMLAPLEGDDVTAAARLVIAHQASGVREWGPAVADDGIRGGDFMDAVVTSVAAVVGPFGRALTDRVGAERAEVVLDEALRDVAALLAIVDPEDTPTPADRLAAARTPGTDWETGEIPVQANNLGAALATLSTQHLLDDDGIRARLVPGTITPGDAIPEDSTSFHAFATRTLDSGAVVAIHEVLWENMVSDLRSTTISPLERRWDE